MESFSRKLQNLTFKTFYRNQVATFDYDDLFADRRILAVSISNSYTRCSGVHIKSFEQSYQRLQELGLDDIYMIDSADWLIGPMMDKKQTPIRGLPDRDLEFIDLVAEQAGRSEPRPELARWWQYMILINHGEPEKLWTAPFRSHVKLSVLKNFELRYRGLTTQAVEKYLVDTKQ
jgi:peroxiredoxin